MDAFTQNGRIVSLLNSWLTYRKGEHGLHVAMPSMLRGLVQLNTYFCKEFRFYLQEF